MSFNCCQFPWCCFTGGLPATGNGDSESDHEIDADDDSEQDRHIQNVETMVASVLRHQETEQNRYWIGLLRNNQETVKEWLTFLLAIYLHRWDSVGVGADPEFGKTVSAKLRDLKVKDRLLEANMIQLVYAFEAKGENQDHEDIVKDWLDDFAFPMPGLEDDTDSTSHEEERKSEESALKLDNGDELLIFGLNRIQLVLVLVMFFWFLMINKLYPN